MKVQINKNAIVRLVALTLFISSLANNVRGQLTTSKNFVATVEVKQPGAQTVSAVNNLSAEQKVIKVEYMDGLGRSEQAVLLNAKSVGTDIVVPKSYDALGRVDKEFLPYAFPAGTGAFRGNWQSEQLSFYQNNNPATLPNDLPDNNPFSIGVYEPSPLNRVIQNFAPGNPWAGTKGTGSNEVSAKTEFKVYNTAAGDLVQSWELNYATAIPTPVISSYTYVTGDLIKTRSLDENGKAVEEYKDKEGNTILKKVQLANTFTSDPHEGWLCTYFVYDNLNRLRHVVPPQATEYLRTHGWLLTQSIIDELCFWYEYDDRNRMITKHVPGAQPVNMVYDKRDRLILTQDGNMAAEGKWLFTLYDHLNRSLATAFWPSSSSRAVLQSQVDLDIVAGNISESILGDNLVVGYKPTFIYIANLDFLSVNYYDIYPSSINYAANASFYNAFALQYSPGTITPSGDYAMPVTRNPTIIGKPVATKAKILDVASTVNGNNYLFAANYYDDEYRVVQTIRQNLYAIPNAFDYGITVVTNQYSFSGILLGSQEILDPYGLPVSVVTKNVYDVGGNITKIYKGTNTSTAAKLISDNEYDILGRLKVKTVGTGTICENKEDYTYNIRGWIRGVNMNYLNDQILTTNQRFFGYELGYNVLSSGGTMTNPQVNGNIGAMVWASAGKAGRDAVGPWSPIPSGAGIKRKYDYTYDNTNRIRKADFLEYKGFWNNAEKDFSVSGADNGMIGYDANGNIRSMKQMGVKGTTVQLIDDLTYHYFNSENSNRLLWVNDAANDQLSTLGDFKENKFFGNTTQDYYYDNNGNLIKDKNKDITTAGFNPNAPAIEYTFLNHPSSIHILNTTNTADKGHITFTYDGLGNKLRKKIWDYTTTPSPTIKTIDYIGSFNFTYEIGNGLNFINTEEGRIRYAIQPSGNLEFKYDWFVKDHLGNIRMVLTEESTPSPLRPYRATFEDVPTQRITKEDIAMERELFGEDVLQPTRNPLPTELRDKDPENKRCALLKPGYTGKVPYKILKVNAGDKFNIGVQYYYRPGAKNTDGSNLRQDIFRNLLNGILGIGTGGGGFDKDRGPIQNPGIRTSPYSDANALDRFTQDDDRLEGQGRRPRAYLNFVLMDTGMQFIKGGALRVGEMDAKDPDWKNLVQNDITATQQGYFLVYISNEEQLGSNLGAGNVYFDNLVIITNEGPVMEEDHYYPFGLLIHPISTNGSGRLQNKVKYNGKELQNNEFSDGSGLEWYEYGARTYDVQICRFFCQDHLSDKFTHYSPYQYAGNQVPNAIDLDGLEQLRLNQINSTARTFSGEFVLNIIANNSTVSSLPTINSIKFHNNVSRGNGVYYFDRLPINNGKPVTEISKTEYENGRGFMGIITFNNSYSVQRNRQFNRTLEENKYNPAYIFMIENPAAVFTLSNSLFKTETNETPKKIYPNMNFWSNGYIIGGGGQTTMEEFVTHELYHIYTGKEDKDNGRGLAIYPTEAGWESNVHGLTYPVSRNVFQAVNAAQTRWTIAYPQNYFSFLSNLSFGNF